MSGKIKTHRRSAHRWQAKLSRDLAKADAGMHNHKGGGCLLPSQLGWGQHKANKARITLPKIGGHNASPDP